MTMRYAEIITEGRDAFLYHGYSDPKFASMALSSGKMAATSTQRFWPDGRRRRETIDADYEQSYWMKGVSFTRDIRYAMAWGSIVFEVNQAKLAQRTKLIPFSWGFHMSGYADTSHKREREEFAVVKATPDTYKFPDDYETQPGKLDISRFTSAKGQIEGYLPLAPILEGIWMHTDLGSMSQPAPSEYDFEQKKHIRVGTEEKESYQAADMAATGYTIQRIIDHPKFKGYYEGGRRNDPPGFKVFPPTTPRTALPPRDY